jgi:pimeloyl-ACP methyl ester carboxylesterase
LGFEQDHYYLIFISKFIMETPTSVTANTGNYADVNGIRMYYETVGSGRPLVLIHGGGSTINTTFGTILPFLAQNHRVIAVEMQAHGRTSDRPGAESFQQDADDVAELLKQLGITAADIFGFSNGGQTSIEIALRHPHLVRHIIIASAFYTREGTPAEFWTGFEQPKFSDMPQLYKDEYLKLNPNPEALMNMFNKDANRMRTFQDWKKDDIRTIQAPTLIIIGDQDIVRPEHAVEMYRLLPNARLAILPGNHGSYMGEASSPNTNSKIPELFVAMIEEFLALPLK